MPARTARSVAAALLVGASLAASPPAASQVSCHCFRDREYDPAAAARTDPYLLATAANSLLAASSGIPKGDIVRARMSGTPREDLWVAAYAAPRIGVKASELLSARPAAPSWREVFRARSAPLERLGTRFVSALAGAGGDAAVGWAAAAETLTEGLGTPTRELDALALRGATLQEAVLAALLGAWAGRPAQDVLAGVRGGGTSWSAELARLGLVPGGVEERIGRTLADWAPSGGRPPP